MGVVPRIAASIAARVAAVADAYVAADVVACILLRVFRGQAPSCTSFSARV